MKKHSRALESLLPLFGSDCNKAEAIILTSSSDEGVVRNGGRNGARLAPKSILNLLKKQNNHLLYQKNSILIKEVTSQTKENSDFISAQEASANQIKRVLQENCFAKKVIHIGGGHDHAYPFLLALQNSNKYDNILILNFDAHCDTRIDDIHHSGTPFRNYDSKASLPYHLVQIGIQNYANSKTTLTQLQNGSQKYFFIDDTIKIAETDFDLNLILKECPFQVSNKTAIYFSLDCDAIDGSIMRGVSAPNGDGLTLDFIDKMLKKILDATKPSDCHFGIYEYNPVYDDLSSLGARSLIKLIYNYLSL